MKQYSKNIIIVSGLLICAMGLWITIGYVKHPSKDTLSRLQGIVAKSNPNQFSGDIRPEFTYNSIEEIENLNIGYISNSEAEIISDVVNLERLRIFDTKITHLDFLKGARKLRSLEIVKAPRLKDISGVAECTALKHFSLQWTNVSDLGAVTKLGELEELQIWESPITGLPSFRNLKSIRRVDLAELSNLKDLSGLRDAIGLKELQVINMNHVSTIDSILALRDLEKLRLIELGITDIRSLEDLQNLKHLDLSYCRNIHDFYPIAALTNLEVLNVGGTFVNDLSFLASHDKLRVFQASNAPALHDISILDDIPSLKVIVLANTPANESSR